ncbi:protein of heat shock protein Hsp70 family [Pseudohyphozyma bogoriensis]|nr:protein of heat shock protein Hsp70 family [Pseudohyphozyma bogoriensis]
MRGMSASPRGFDGAYAGGAGTVGTMEREVARRVRENNSAEGKLSVGIDFGTTFSGVAFGSTRLFSGQIRQILNWPGSYETYRKIPSCILYSQPDPNREAVVVAWGLEAKAVAVRPGSGLINPSLLHSPTSDPRLPPLPHGKDATDVIADFLRCVWKYARGEITEEIGSVVDLDAADVLLTVPAAWDAAGCALMREAAIRAQLVQSSRAGDKNWRERLRIITCVLLSSSFPFEGAGCEKAGYWALTCVCPVLEPPYDLRSEPEAAAIHASTLSTLHNLKPTQSFIICDAGGGTVDTSVFRIMGELSALEVAELCARSGSNCGSLFVDLKFEELLRRLLKDHPIHLDPPSLAAFMHAFSETDKLAYHGTAEDDEAFFRFNCFNVEDCNDPEIGLEWGELAIPGWRIKKEVFDPIINQVLALLEHQMAKLPSLRVDAIILVGGFAASEYLFTRVQQTFGARVGTIARPNDCDVATLQGAARYGLGLSQGKKAVSSVVCPRSYCMTWEVEVKLPAEPIDHHLRPQYITYNDARLEICTNRLSYLVEKGAVLQKGVRLRSRFCKYTKGPDDSFFQAVLYVSDGDEIYRYTDEGETSELCRWTVNLASLPNFQYIARSGGGYVEFDLGLELDSAEVRGVLLSDEGLECGKASHGGNGMLSTGQGGALGGNAYGGNSAMMSGAAAAGEGLQGAGENEGKLSVGTTFSGIAYGSNRSMSGQIRQILSWPGSYETYRKVPTCILYHQRTPSEPATVLAWGLEAKTLGPSNLTLGQHRLFLSPDVLRDGRGTSSARLPELPYGKEPIDVIVDFLTCLWTYAKTTITEEIGSVADLEAADVLLTVPAAWDAAGCAIMRQAALKAGLVQSSRGGDKNWRDRLRIITEPEAAAIHASTLTTLHRLRASQSFIICDAGGGTVDTAAYKLIGQLSQLEIAEMCARSGSNCGSLFLDLRFEALIRSILRDHPTHLDAASLAAFRHAFSETDKLTYLGEEDDDTQFRFNCFNIEDGHDPEIGLEYGELAIPGHVLRRDVFDPVINQVLELVETQLLKTPNKEVNALILVGGFASSEYLFKRMQQTFGDRIPVIARPNDCDVATLQGAARYGLGLTGGKAAYQRPGFIAVNDAGIEVCENRLSYLVAKGAVLRKGQRLRSRFCKYSRGPSDCLFTAILYVSDADQIFRYTDEGETYELCRWTVDLSSLPAFYYNSQNSTGGFYTEFDLGLELDSAEVRGVLLNDEGEECGRATFEFIGQ